MYFSLITVLKHDPANVSLFFPFTTDLSLLTRIPGRPHKEPVEIKVERDDCAERDGKEVSRHGSEKSSSKGKRKHKVHNSEQAVRNVFVKNNW